MRKGKTQHVRNQCGIDRNKETLSRVRQKSGARGRGSVILLFPDHHRSPRSSNWVRKEGTSSANTSLATPSSSLPPTLVPAARQIYGLKKSRTAGVVRFICNVLILPPSTRAPLLTLDVVPVPGPRPDRKKPPYDLDTKSTRRR